MGDPTRPDARRASNAPVKSPVEALESGETSDPGSEAESGGAGGAAGDANDGAAGNESDDGNDGKEGAGGAGGAGARAAPIEGIWLVSPGSDEKERMPGGTRVFADSSIARRASPASVDREREGDGKTEAGAEGC